MNSGEKERRVLIVAGEPSSDYHAARLLTALSGELANVRAFGMGGSALRAAGCETIVDSETHGSLMGITELWGSIGKILAAFSALVDRSRKERPDLAILVDYPDFNLRLAKKLKAMGVPVLYFISPQLWAWRSGRVKQMKERVRKVAPIFPFEEAFYHRHGVDAEYVGHPLVETVPSIEQIEAVLKREGIDRQRKIVALLPGSRSSELKFLMPVLSETGKLLEERYPGIQIVVPAAPGVVASELKERFSLPSHWKVTTGGAREIMAAADAACLASGTATVEAALAGVPMVVIYRLTPTSYFLAKLLVRGVSSFAMPNLILGEKFIPELLQHEVTSERIFNELNLLLSEPERASVMREKLKQVCAKLASPHGGSAAARAGAIAKELLLEGESNR